MPLSRFDPGDRVRVDIPNESDPDFDVYTVHGTIVEVRTDDAGRVTGHDRDSIFYRVRLDCGEERDVRGRDLRPPLE